jgi:uncharacterized damage-inducible protein DinB
MNTLFTQYEFVKDSRERLLKYCEGISPQDFLKEHENFGGRSIQFLLIHVANVYEFYLKNFIEDKGFPSNDNYLIDKIYTVKKHYEKINEITNVFIDKYKDNFEGSISGKIPNYNLDLKTTPLKIFTHAVTHEFHHKGQILSISRLLGYKPIDTDIIHFS